jgi:hypothetical protein
MTKFINLTPHVLNIHDGGTIVNVPPSGHVARIKVTRIPHRKIQGVTVWATQKGPLEGLENLVVDGDDVLVTSLAAKEEVAKAFPNNLVTSPGTLLRDQNGQPLGCDGLDA